MQDDISRFQLKKQIRRAMTLSSRLTAGLVEISIERQVLKSDKSCSVDCTVALCCCEVVR